jgi:hypothetical protein
MTHGCQAAIWYSCVEAAEDLLSAGPVLGDVDLRWPGVSLRRRQLAQGSRGRAELQWIRHWASTGAGDAR